MFSRINCDFSFSVLSTLCKSKWNQEPELALGVFIMDYELCREYVHSKRHVYVLLGSRQYASLNHEKNTANKQKREQLVRPFKVQCRSWPTIKTIENQYSPVFRPTTTLGHYPVSQRSIRVFLPRSSWTWTWKRQT